jgi:uncharacterized protein HemX
MKDASTSEKIRQRRPTVYSAEKSREREVNREIRKKKSRTTKAILSVLFLIAALGTACHLYTGTFYGLQYRDYPQLQQLQKYQVKARRWGKLYYAMLKRKMEVSRMCLLTQ